jgi:hypothetical protein
VGAIWRWLGCLHFDFIPSGTFGAEDEVDGFDEPFDEGGIRLGGGLEAVPGFKEGGG